MRWKVVLELEVEAPNKEDALSKAIADIMAIGEDMALYGASGKLPFEWKASQIQSSNHR